MRFSALQNKLKRLWEQKQELLKRIKNLNLKALFDEVKSLKERRDRIVNDVKNLKKIRETNNLKIKENFEKIKSLKNSVKNPEKLKKELENLNFFLQTEVLSYEKEKRLTKKLKALEADYKKIIDSNEWQSFKKIKDELKALKALNEKLSFEIKEKAKESQSLHLNYLEALKLAQEKRKEFLELKEKIKETNSEIYSINSKIIENLKTFSDEKKEFFKRDKALKENLKAKLNELNATLSQNLKMGKKITTENLIELQKLEEFCKD